jgi:hypothetical protein
MAALGLPKPTHIKACAGVDGAPCPQGKTVIRTERCPDCTLAHARIRSHAAAIRVGAKAKARISKPEHVAKPEPFERHDDFGADQDDDRETDPEIEALDEALHTPAATTRAPRRNTPARGDGFKPGTRQLEPKPALPTSERNWWETAKPGEMTKTAHAEQPRMSASREAKRVSSGFVNDGSATPTAFKTKLPPQ